jgi:hypothetical protein
VKLKATKDGPCRRFKDWKQWGRHAGDIANDYARIYGFAWIVWTDGCVTEYNGSEYPSNDYDIGEIEVSDG